MPRAATGRLAAAVLVCAAVLAACSGGGASGGGASGGGASGGGASSTSTSALASGDVAVTTDVRYGSDGATDLTLDVYAPTASTSTASPSTASPSPSGARPAVVLVHGGGWSSGSASDVGPDAQAFAEAGLVAFAIDYRLDEDGDGPGWPDELTDVLTALAWVGEHAADYEVDPARLGVYGSSAGGHLALLAATRRDGVDGPAPRAVVSWSGPTDLRTLAVPTLEPGDAPSTTVSADDAPSGCADDPVCLGILDPEAIAAFVGCALDDCPDTYADASPITHVGPSMPPTYLVSYTEDLVPLAQQQDLVTAMQAAGVVHQLQVLDGEGHAEQARAQAIGPSTQWFLTHL